MKKGRIIAGLILNILIIGGVGFAISNAFFGFWGAGAVPKGGDPLELFYYFTIDSNILLAVGALLMIFVDIAMLKGKKASRFFQSLKLVGVVGTTITAGIVGGYFYAVQKQPVDFLYNLEYNLYLHGVVPALGLASFIVENKPRMKPWKYAFLGLVPVAAYGGSMIPLLNLNVLPKEKAPYDFLLIDMNNIWVSIAWFAGFAVGAYLLALLILVLHNIGSNEQVEEAKQPEPEPEAKEPEPELPPLTKVEPAPEGEKPEEEAAPETQEQPEAENPPAEEPAPEAKPEEVTVLAPRTAYARPKLRNPNVRTYHITKQPNGEWQVKLAGGKKAIKVFPTQREAIAFARGLVESRGGSYRIHSVKGKIRS